MTKKDSIKQILEDIEKQYGKGAIMRMNEKDYPEIERISTGSIALDSILSGGVPRGRIIEVFGKESSGKTTLTLHIIAEAQKLGDTVAFVDAEHSLDTKWAKLIGVDVDNLLISQPDSGEQALGIVESLVRSGGIKVVVIDSVAALTPRAEIEGEMGDTHIGLQARLMSQAMRKLTSLVKNTNTTVIFINQIRMKIGVMWGSNETTPGGTALKFYSSLRLDLRRIGMVKNGNDIIGAKIKAKVTKSKVSVPFRTTEFDIMFDEGISQTGEIIDIALSRGLIEQAGAWFNYGEISLGQGRENTKKFLKENKEMFDELRKKL